MANRLANATSPYLLQHADNPVDWWEWGPEAFAEAKRRDVPILLSVGYSACHWCHVMAHESFEDPATAAFMNEHFVNIKVDREERPDVDAIYMQATVAMTGQGGWPMTVVLDQDAQPFYAGTYFPPTPRHGQPAFTQVLQALSHAWREQRDQVGKTADSLREHLAGEPSLASGTALTAGVTAEAVRALATSFDGQNAGFGGAPKFPPSMLLEFLLRHSASGAETAGIALDMVRSTCDAMARGGLYDQLGGGFARYSVDAAWVVPHFEKMLYDNAQLIGVYAGLAATGDELAERVVRESLHWLEREMLTDHGAYAAALDADSDGAEGTFYVWTPAELEEVLEADGAYAAELLQVSEAGTFEDGRSTLQLRADPDDWARWESIKQRLDTARDRRTRPHRDDKVVAGWNGMTIAALARAGMVLGEPAWIDRAVRAGHLIWGLHWVDGRLRRVSRDGVVGKPTGVLDDYGCLADGYVGLAEATGDQLWLDRAAELLEVAITHFAAEDGGFFDTADDAEELITRPRDPSDNASPSGLSAVVNALVRYAALTGETGHREVAERALASMDSLLTKVPRFAGYSLAAAELVLGGPLEIVVVTEPGDAEGSAMAKLARAHRSAVSLVVAPGRSDVALAEDRPLVDGRAAAYVCRGMVCDRPVTTAAELAKLIGAAASA